MCKVSQVGRAGHTGGSGRGPTWRGTSKEEGEEAKSDRRDSCTECRLETMFMGDVVREFGERE